MIIGATEVRLSPGRALHKIRREKDTVVTDRPSPWRCFRRPHANSPETSPNCPRRIRPNVMSNSGDQLAREGHPRSGMRQSAAGQFVAKVRVTLGGMTFWRWLTTPHRRPASDSISRSTGTRPRQEQTVLAEVCHRQFSGQNSLRSPVRTTETSPVWMCALVLGGVIASDLVQRVARRASDIGAAVCHANVRIAAEVGKRRAEMDDSIGQHNSLPGLVLLRSDVCSSCTQRQMPFRSQPLVPDLVAASPWVGGSQRKGGHSILVETGRGGHQSGGDLR